MKIRFRGGPHNNRSNDMTELRMTVMIAEVEPLPYEEIKWDQPQPRDFTTKMIKHIYQLGKDKNGKSFYFYVGV